MVVKISANLYVQLCTGGFNFLLHGFKSDQLRCLAYVLFVARLMSTSTSDININISVITSVVVYYNSCVKHRSDLSATGKQE